MSSALLTDQPARGLTPDRPLTSDHRRRRRRALPLLLGLLVLAVAACQPVWPVGTPYLNAADAAAGWLTTDYEANGDSYAPGMYADLVFALAATYNDRPTAEAALADLEGVTPGYVQPGGFFNPGATGKVMLAVQALHHDPNDFAGLDLEAMLRSSLVTSGPDAGRFGTAGVFNHALATMALARTSGKAPAAAGAWLSAQQCPDGSFSWGPCDFADADHTALAVSAMAAAGGQTAAVQAGTQWLLDTQNPDGGWGIGGDTSNTNSTGLAVQVLRLQQHHTAAEAAAQWVKGLQVASGDAAGAIPWRPDADGNLFLATTQAVLAFGAGPFHQLAFPTVVGTPCPSDDDGVTVIVDLARFDSTVKLACAPGAPATGWEALEAAGFSVGSVPGFEGQAICTINDRPTGGYPECWDSGFWSYWHDETRSGTWDFSNFGAAGRTPPVGSVEGWRYEPDWATHWAVPPGVGSLFGERCGAPTAPLDSPIAASETIPFTGRRGAPVEVAVLDGSVPLDLPTLASATFTETVDLALDGQEGLVRVLARSADPSCATAERPLFHAVYEVTPAGSDG